MIEKLFEECIKQASCTHGDLAFKLVGMRAPEYGAVVYLFKDVDVSVRAECVHCGLTGEWLRQKAALPTPRKLRQAIKSFYEKSLEVQKTFDRLMIENEKGCVEAWKIIRERQNENCGREMAKME